MKFSKTLLLSLILVLSLTSHSHGAISVLMKLEGVSVPKSFGTKSQLKGFDDGWANILGASTGFAVNVDTVGGTSRAVSKPSYSDLVITKWADELSPLITLAGVSGQRLPKVTVSWVSADGGGNNTGTLMEFIMEDVFVSSSAMSGSDGEDRGTESVSFNWGKLTMNSYSEDLNTGAIGTSPTTSVKIDRAQGTAE